MTAPPCNVGDGFDYLIISAQGDVTICFGQPAPDHSFLNSHGSVEDLKAGTLSKQVGCGQRFSLCFARTNTACAGANESKPIAVPALVCLI